MRQQPANLFAKLVRRTIRCHMIKDQMLEPIVQLLSSSLPLVLPWEAQLFLYLPNSLHIPSILLYQLSIPSSEVEPALKPQPVATAEKATDFAFIIR